MLPVSELPGAVMTNLLYPAFLLEVILKGSLVLALALIGVQFWRHAPASARHLVLGLALAVNVLLPLCATWAPTWQAPALPLVTTTWQFGPTTSTDDAGDAATTAGGVDSPGASPLAVSPEPAIVHDAVAQNWGLALAWLWIAGAALVTVRLCLALVVVGRILIAARPAVDPAWSAIARNCRQRVGVHRDIPLLISRRATVPFTWGWIRPRIILPTDSRLWTDHKLEIILLHELAHIKRWDAVSTGLAQLAAILYWFNPLVWMTRRSLLVERERACDNWVISTGIKRSAYAGCLLEVARTAGRRRWLPELQIAMAQRTSFEERIMAIVTERKDRAPLGTRRLTMGLLVSLIMILPLAGVQIFAQQSDPAETHPSSTSTTSQVGPAQVQAITTVLDEFYRALNRGDDYDDVIQRYLTTDFFNDHMLTFENWPDQRRKQVMHNTLRQLVPTPAADPSQQGGADELKASIERDRKGPAQMAYQAEVLECRQVDGTYILTQRINIGSSGLDGKKPSLVTDLVLTIKLVEQDGIVKIRSYDGGIGIQRMDVGSPHGPILVVVFDHDAQAIPAGPMLFKSIPNSLVSSNVNLIPLRADTDDS